jgi:hypothetical protein
MRTEDGRMFDDSKAFTALRSSSSSSSSASSADAGISEVTAPSAQAVRVHFSDDLRATTADDLSRYTVVRADGAGSVAVTRVSIADDRTVNLTLGSALAERTTYRLKASKLLTMDGGEFTDERSFSYTPSGTGSGMFRSVSAAAANRLRLTFAQPLDENVAEDEFRYTVRGTQGALGISQATLTASGTVELALLANLSPQAIYTVTVNGLETDDGDTFEASIPFTYSEAPAQFTALLTGSREIPSVSSLLSGTGSFTLSGNDLQYSITLSGTGSGMVTGAHFHKGDANTEGGVWETITFNGMRATGTWTGLTAEERAALLSDGVYVNVHTNGYPDGEIRGQVLRR